MYGICITDSEDYGEGEVTIDQSVDNTEEFDEDDDDDEEDDDEDVCICCSV